MESYFVYYQTKQKMESIYHLVQIKGQLADVYRAVTTKKGLEGWWTTQVTDVDSEHWRFHFPGDYSKLFKITNGSENQVSWKCVEATPEWVRTEVEFQLVQDGENVVVNFRHGGWNEMTPLYGVCNYHWGLYLKSLKDLVETGKGQPTPAQ